MNVITASEFRRNQRKYFDLAETEPVFITRMGRVAFTLTPLGSDSDFTAEELQSIQRGVEDVKAGRTKQVTAENLWDSIG